MALDGVFLRHLKKELEEKLLGGRVDKIYQPNREEMTVAFRTRESVYKVLFSARANSARVHFTSVALENPKQPPMLCMLLRKRLTGSKLLAIRQPGTERVLHFDFDALNELGDHVVLTLTAEIMGRYSNIVLTGEDGRIIDALKRVDAEMSSQRLILPGLAYRLPPPQEKRDVLDTSAQELLSALRALPADAELGKALLSMLQGVSPIVCREIAHRAGRGAELTVKAMDEEQYFRTGFFYQQMKEAAEQTSGEPHMAVSLKGKPMDFSFFDIRQYGTSAVIRKGESFSSLLDDFYRERDQQERMRVREQDLLKLLSTHSERLSRKINAQQAELSQCAQRDSLRVAGDLISANLYALPKGAAWAELPNYYEESQPVVRVKLDPALTPSQNAQKYYKEYRKAKTAEEKLTEQIAIAHGELEYLDSVLDALSRAETEQDLQEIRGELREQGYVRASRDKKRKEPGVSAPMKFTTSDGFTVLVTEGKEPTPRAMEEAAALCAAHSRAKDSAQVPVDYTRVRNVSKPQGAKPGMVIYVNYKTLFVDPMY